MTNNIKIMSVYKFMILLICLSFIIGGCYSQTKQKKDVYLYFKEDLSKHIYKGFANLKATNEDKEEKRYDVYWYKLTNKKNGRPLIFAYVPVNMHKFEYKDESFVKSSVKTIEQLQDIDSFGYDTRDEKRFPFKKVYIVEYVAHNMYKVIQVETHLSSYF
jgi:hypothetical protein